MAAELLSNRYQIERRLGGGSQAEVYLAQDLQLERAVAVKIWKPEGGFTVDEFLREAKLLARFGPPYFVTIHEHAVTADQRPFFVLEYLEGETLENLSEPLSTREIRGFVRDVCVGMQRAHDEGIVHRDLKPSNVMVVNRGTRSERFVILDLGIAKITNGGNWRKTLANSTLSGAGTLLYMSPEQCRGEEIDRRTDIYAFGCLLFKLFVNEEPFAHKATNQVSVISAILNDPPRWLKEVRPDVPFPNELELLLQECLAKNPDERPAEMSDVERDFLAVLEDDTTDSPAIPQGDSAVKERLTGSKALSSRRLSIGTIPPPALSSGDTNRHRDDTGRSRNSARQASSSRRSARPPGRSRWKRALGVGLGASLVGLAIFLLVLAPVGPKEPSEIAEPAKSVSPSDHTSPSDQAVASRQAGPEQTPDQQPRLDRVPEIPVSTAPKNSVSVSNAAAPAQLESNPASALPKMLPVPRVKDDEYSVLWNQTLKADDQLGDHDKNPNNNGLFANDFLPEGARPKIECVQRPTNGELTKLNDDGTFLYVPASQSGRPIVHSDAFTYRVRASERDPWSNSATVQINIKSFSDEQAEAIKNVRAKYSEQSVQEEENPPRLRIDLSEPTIKHSIRDESLNLLVGLQDIVQDFRLDGQPITDKAMERVRSLPKLRSLSLRGTDVSDTGVAGLRGLTNLSELDLSDTAVTEEGVGSLMKDRGGRLNIRRDGALDKLRATGARITAEPEAELGRPGFVVAIRQANQFRDAADLLKAAPRLVGLDLTGSDVTDELVTVDRLRTFGALKRLNLHGTLVSSRHESDLRREFPLLRVEWESPLTQIRRVGKVKLSNTNDILVDLSKTKVADRTWTLLGQVQKLVALNLSAVPLEKSEFERLCGLGQIRELVLQETRLTAEQLVALCQRLGSLVMLDVARTATAGDAKALWLLLTELRNHDPKAQLHPSWSAELQPHTLTVGEILKERCDGCHRGKGSIGKHFNALNYSTLFLPRESAKDPLIVPGKLDRSDFWKKIETGEMPESGSVEKEKFTSAEKEILRLWIENGAPAWSAAELRTNRPFLGIPQVLRSIRDDLRKAPIEDRPHLRYFTLTHLHNQPHAKVSDADLRLYRAALSKALNSLSWEVGIVMPRAVDRQATIFAIDLRDFGWERNGVWKRISASYPYGLSYDENHGRESRDLFSEIVSLSGSLLPSVRADWFIASATRAPLYYEILALPTSAVALEQKLDIDFARNFKTGRLMRAGFTRRGVHHQNIRIVERQDAIHGAYWKTYDFRRGHLIDQLKHDPLGPVFDENPFKSHAFRHSASEILFQLPNDLQAYMLVDRQGKRVDEVPEDIDLDSHRAAGSTRMVAGLSCIACHAEGMKTRFVDVIRTGTDLGGDEQLHVQRLYPEPQLLREKLEADRQRFLAASQQAMGPFLQIGIDQPRRIETFDEPIGRVSRYYLREHLDAARAAAELGIEPAKLVAAIEGDIWLSKPGLKPLIQGGSLSRQEWEKDTDVSLMQRVAKEMKLGTPVREQAAGYWGAPGTVPSPQLAPSSKRPAKVKP